AVAGSGLNRRAIDFTVSGSSDAFDGRPFGFTYALEAVGAYPATAESHVEMDGARAAYYAWLKIISGEGNAALVFSWGKGSTASLHQVSSAELDPFCLAPLGLDAVATAALQADAWMHRTRATTLDLDRVAARARSRGARNESMRSM